MTPPATLALCANTSSLAPRVARRAPPAGQEAPAAPGRTHLPTTSEGTLLVDVVCILALWPMEKQARERARLRMCEVPVCGASLPLLRALAGSKVELVKCKLVELV